MPKTAIPTEAVDRIVRAVGPRVTLVPAGLLDPSTVLSYRLDNSMRQYRLARKGHSDADKKLQVRQLGSILKAGSKLRALLKSPQGWDWLKEFEFEALDFELDYSLTKARWLIDELENKLKYGDDYQAWLRDG